MKYSWVLFDLDGTITNPYDGITGSIKYACKKMNIVCPDESILRLFIGPPLVDSFSEYCLLSKEDATKATALYREQYKRIGIEGNIVYEGMHNLLALLKSKGIKISLATSKPEEFATLILKRFDLFKYFDFIGGNDLNESRAKKVDVIKYVLNSCNIEPSKALMIGDRKFDIEAGKQFGLDTLAVTYGYGSKEELNMSQPTYFASNVGEIYDIVVCK